MGILIITYVVFCALNFAFYMEEVVDKNKTYKQHMSRFTVVGVVLFWLFSPLIILLLIAGAALDFLVPLLFKGK